MRVLFGVDLREMISYHNVSIQEKIPTLNLQQDSNQTFTHASLNLGFVASEPVRNVCGLKHSVYGIYY